MQFVKGKGYFLKALFYPIAFTVLIFLIWSLFITYGSFKMSSVPVMVNVVSAIAVFMAGFMCAKGRSKKGLVMGVIGAIIYIFASIIISFAFKGMIDFNFSVNAVIKIFAGVIIGAIGGIIGINFASKPKRKLR